MEESQRAREMRLEAEEIARQESDHKYKVSIMRQLAKFGMENFNDKGHIRGKDDELVESCIPGKHFLKDIIYYFEQEDETYAYKYCATAKELLDAHIEKFGGS